MADWVLLGNKEVPEEEEETPESGWTLLGDQYEEVPAPVSTGGGLGIDTPGVAPETEQWMGETGEYPVTTGRGVPKDTAEPIYEEIGLPAGDVPPNMVTRESGESDFPAALESALYQGAEGFKHPVQALGFKESAQTMHDFYRKAADDSPRIKKFKKDMEEGKVSFLEKIVSSLGPTAAGAGAYVIPWAGLPLAVTYFYGMNAEETFDTAKQLGASDEDAQSTARVAGAFSTLLESAGISKLTKIFKPAAGLGKWLVTYLEGIATESGTEGLQQAISYLSSRFAAKPKNESNKKFISRMWEEKDKLGAEVWEAATVGGGVSALLGLPGVTTVRRDPTIQKETEVEISDKPISDNPPADTGGEGGPGGEAGTPVVTPDPVVGDDFAALDNEGDVKAATAEALKSGVSESSKEEVQKQSEVEAQVKRQQAEKANQIIADREAAVAEEDNRQAVAARDRAQTAQAEVAALERDDTQKAMDLFETKESTLYNTGKILHTMEEGKTKKRGVGIIRAAYDAIRTAEDNPKTLKKIQAKLQDLSMYSADKYERIWASSLDTVLTDYIAQVELPFQMEKGMHPQTNLKGERTAQDRPAAKAAATQSMETLLRGQPTTLQDPTVSPAKAEQQLKTDEATRKAIAATLAFDARGAKKEMFLGEPGNPMKAKSSVVGAVPIIGETKAPAAKVTPEPVVTAAAIQKERVSPAKPATVPELFKQRKEELRKATSVSEKKVVIKKFKPMLEAAQKRKLDEKKPTDKEVKFARSVKSTVSRTSPEHHATIKRAVDKLQAMAVNAAKTVVHARQTDLPANILKAVDKTVDAFYDKDTKTVHIIAENIPDAKTAAKKWLHEQVGHKALRDLFDKLRVDFNKFLDEVYSTVTSDKVASKIMTELEALYRGDMDALELKGDARNQYLAEEFLAKKSESLSVTKRNKVFQKFRDFINKWFEKIFGIREGKGSQIGLWERGEKFVTMEDIPVILEIAKNRLMYDEIRAIDEVKHTDEEYKDMAKTILKIAPDVLTWYDNHIKLVDEVFGKDAAIFNAIVALNSKGARVNTNAFWAVESYLYMLGRRKKPGGRWPNKEMQKLDEFRNGALEGIQGNQAKLQEMVRAMLGDETATVNDRWMYRLFFGDPMWAEGAARDFADKSKPKAFSLGAIASVGWTDDLNISSRHMLFKLTAELREETGHDWTPRQLQAALWTHHKMKSEGTHISKRMDYLKALQTPVRKYGGKTAIQFLHDELKKPAPKGAINLGELHKVVKVSENPLKEVSDLHEKYLAYLEKHNLPIPFSMETGKSDILKDVGSGKKYTKEQLNVSSTNYKDGSSAPSNKNVLVRNTKAKSNKGRVLLCQISSNQKSDAATDIGDKYYDTLYEKRKGYERPKDFWEIPQWIGYAAKSLDSDLYVVRNAEEAIQFMNQAGYDAVMFSVLDSNKHFVKIITDQYKGKSILGGYVDPAYFNSNSRATWHKDMKSATKQLGVEYKTGVSYRHFRGSATIPRLELSSGCKYKCAFCTVSTKIIMPSRSTIDAQVESFRELDFEFIYLNDKTFGQATNHKAITEINKRVREFNPKFQGFIVQTTAVDLNKMSDEFLQDSGIALVELGVETYNDTFLSRLNKPHRTKHIDAAANKLRKNNIELVPNIMVGLAGKHKGEIWTETAETYQNTLDFLEANKDIVSHVNSYILAVYSGTEISSQLDETVAEDADENVVMKSWLKDPKLHEKFYRDVTNFGLESLKRGEDRRARVANSDSLVLDNKVVTKGEFTGKNSPLLTRRFAILTAENPGVKQKTAKQNALHNKRLLKELDKRGIKYTPVAGKYIYKENSFIIFDISAADAQAIGTMFNQESVMVNEGLLYQDGTINPSDLSKINYSSKQSDFYSTVSIDGEAVKFSIPIDFDTKVKLGEVEYNIRKSYAGESAETADKGKLQEAQKLIEDGTTANEVRKKTGWFQSPMDKMWRFEIFDGRAKLDISKLDEYTHGAELQEIYTHPQLFKAYPHLKDIFTVIHINEKYQGVGEFMDRANTIMIGAPNAEVAKEVLTHEIQHAIQYTEGFARGGSVNEFTVRLKEINSELSSLAKRMDTWRNDPDTSLFNNLKKQYDGLMNEKLRWTQDLNPGEDYATQAYKRLAGEIEARDVAYRSTMGEGLLEQYHPYYAVEVKEGIKTSEAQVRFKGQRAMSEGAAAEFTGWFEGMGDLPNTAVYTVDIDGAKTTVTAETLKAKGIPVPKTPSFKDWQSSKVNIRFSRVTLKDRVDPKFHDVIDNVGVQQTAPESFLKSLGMKIGDWLVTQGIDELHPIKMLERGMDIDAAMSGYKSSRLLSSFPTILEKFLYDGLPQFQDNWIKIGRDTKGGLFSIAQRLGKDVQPFFLRMTAKSAQEMYDKGRRSLFGEGIDDLATIRDLLAATDPLYTANKGVWDSEESRLKEVNKSILDFAEKSGLINKEGRDAWERENYIPFHRVVEDLQTGDVEAMFPTSGAQIKTIIHELKGGKSKVGDPLVNLTNSYSFILHESLKNLARKKSMVIMLNSGIATRTVKVDKHKSVLNIRHNGKAQYYRVSDRYLYDALANLNNHTQHMLIRVLGMPKHWLTYGVTFHPAFRVSNLFRDTIHTTFMEKSFRPVVDSVIGFWEAMAKTPEFVEFESTGGAFSGSYAMRDVLKNPTKAVNKLVAEAMKGKDGVWKRVDPLTLWEKIGEASENAARFGLYKRLKASGMSAADAGFQAKDLLDFHMSGKSQIIKGLISVIPFLNARIQGLYKVSKTAVDPKTRGNLIVKGAILATLVGLLHAWNADDDRYKELTDSERYSYFHFFDVPGIGHFRLPIPFEVGIMFGTFPVAMGQYLNGTMDGKDMLAYLKHSATETLMFDPLAQFYKPIEQQVSNKDRFTKAPIVPKGLEGVKSTEQYTPWTSKTAREVGKFIDSFGILSPTSPFSSPARIDKLVNDYFSYLGYATMYLSDQILENVLEYPEDPAVTVSERYISGVGRFVRGDDPPRSTKSQQDFYKMLIEADNAYNTVRHFKKIKMRDEAREYKKEHRPDIKLSKKLGRTQEKVAKLNNKMNVIHANKTMSSEEKRVEINKLLEKRNALFKRAVERTK